VDNFESYPIGAPPPAPWKVGGGTWDVLGDVTTLPATKEAQTVVAGPIYTGLTGSSAWTDYRVTASVKAPATGFAKVVARYQDPGDMYVCGIENGSTLYLGKLYGGAWYSFQTTSYSYSATTWYTVSLTVMGESLTCTAYEPGTGHTQTVTATAGYFASGPAGFYGSAGAEFDNLNVTTV
jgi:hypothetical protein